MRRIKAGKRGEVVKYISRAKASVVVAKVAKTTRSMIKIVRTCRSLEGRSRLKGVRKFLKERKVKN